MRTRILGEFDPGLLPEFAADAERTAEEAGADGRVEVARLLRQHRRPDREPVLLLTSRDLNLKGCRSAFGYADRRRQVAVVSSFRLEGNAARLANVVAHELGHLRGLKHCSDPGCLMHPAAQAEDIDARGSEPCPRCRRARFNWLATAAAVAFFAFAIAGLDGFSRLLKPSREPFAWRGRGDSATVLYRRESVLEFRQAGAAERARAAAQSLNTLFLQIRPAQLQVLEAPDRVLVRAGGVTVAELLPADSRPEPPARFARSWVRRIEPLIRGKGTAAEGCPDCHIYRIPDIEANMRARGQRSM